MAWHGRPCLYRSLIHASADTATVIANADPGDYGDRILVAMNVQITESGESTDRAAAVRDAGVKVSAASQAGETRALVCAGFSS